MTWRQHDSIMVVVDKLMKVAHFIPVKSTHKMDEISKIFMKEVFKLHGLPKAIVSDMLSSLLNFGKDCLQTWG